MRRATSYSEAQTVEEAFDDASDFVEVLIGGTTTLTGKHRRLLQTKQAWLKYQVSQSSTTAETFKQKRTKETASKLLAQGGPHDDEFFKCFTLYLAELLKQYAA